MSTLALIGLGSNLGDRKARLDAAVAALAETPGVSFRAVSSYHETAPVGGPRGQGAFLNAAAAVETSLDPFGLLRVLQAIEGREGRVRSVRWGERTLDLDLLSHGSQCLVTPELTLPHPRLALRRVVLAPLAEIAPNIVDPITGRSIAGLLAHLDRRPSYLALDGLGERCVAVFEAIVAGLPAQAIRRESAPGSDLPRVAALISSDRWPAEQVGERWLVSDFSLDVEWERGLREGAAWMFQEPEKIAAGILNPNAYDRWANDKLQPTFIAFLGDPSRFPRKPSMGLKSSALWPEGKDPEAVVAEILAACAATRTG